MDIIAKQTHVRGSVQKLTDVTRVVKHLSVSRMRTQLGQMNKDAARRILETLNQAVANAQHNYGISEDKLVLKEMLILRGPHYKRMRAVSRGMGHAILKRTSHIVITLSSLDKTAGEKKQEVKKVEETSAAPEVMAEVKPKAVAKKPTTKKSTVQKVVAKKTE